MDTVTLYHGSSYDFVKIDLRQGRPYKDFGQGFYTSANIDHAKSMAERNADIRRLKLRKFDREYNTIGSWIYQYQFDINDTSELAIMNFSEADREWGRFVTINRNSRDVPPKYDIVIGPTANDYTNPTIQFYLSGGVGEVGSDAAIDELVRLLLPYKLPKQYFFATQRAIDHLKLVRKERF